MFNKAFFKLREFFRSEKGSVLAEYGLLIVIIVIGAIAVLYQLRDAIIALFQKIIDSLGV